MNDVMKLQNTMLREQQVEIPVQHYFTEGIYARNAVIPAGTLAVGKCHKHSTLNVLLKGEVLIIASVDDPPVRMKAPCVFESAPGTKKAVYAFSDTEILNVHATQETELDKIEQEVILPDEEYVELIEKAGDYLCHG